MDALGKFRNFVTGGAQKTLEKAQYKACPTCGNVTAEEKKDPKEAAKSIDTRRNKATRGNMGD